MKPFLCAFLLSLAAASADIDRTKKPEPGPAPVSSFPAYVLKTLPSGLKVFVIEDDRKPTLTLRLLIKSGSASDAEKSGLAGFVASLLNRGTAKRDAATFASESDFIGMHVEAVAGADAIAVSASGLTKYTDKILDLFSDAVLHPAYPAEQFAKEQRKTLSALAAEKQEPSRLAEKLAGKVLYGAKNPYGAYRTPETVQAITRDDLVQFHKTYFVPNNATLAIVGDVKTADIVALVEKAMEDWKPGDLPAFKMPAPAEIKGVNIHLVNRPGSVQSNIVLGEAGPARNSPNVPELNVLNATLGGGFSGRLFQNLREKHGWTYGAYSAFDLRKYAGAFQANAETRNAVTHLAIAETLKEIARLRDEPVPEAELELQRQYNVGNYLLSLENTSRTAQRVQDIDLYGLPADFYKTYATRMESVTPAVIQDLAKTHLSTENVAITVVGEAKEIQPELEKIGKVFVYDTELKLQ
ncbi:MAG: Peptidase domain protein [Chthoniobacteraceae bacterium]|nr:Peptidase domain protein [Chthoniobacteraceae bacterium]